jgi:hypothetical protein
MLRRPSGSVSLSSMDTPSPSKWKFLGPKPGSTYRQLFITGRNIAARSIYGDFMSAEEPRTLEEIAADRDLPLEAVLEDIAYCQSDPPEIRQDWEEEEARFRDWILNDPKSQFPGKDKLIAEILAQRQPQKASRS